jgi:hypothetical protein
VPPALAAGADEVVFRWRTVPLPARGEAVDPALGDLPTEVALAAGPGCQQGSVFYSGARQKLLSLGGICLCSNISKGRIFPWRPKPVKSCPRESIIWNRFCLKLRIKLGSVDNFLNIGFYSLLNTLQSKILAQILSEKLYLRSAIYWLNSKISKIYPKYLLPKLIHKTYTKRKIDKQENLQYWLNRACKRST